MEKRWPLLPSSDHGRFSRFSRFRVASTERADPNFPEAACSKLRQGGEPVSQEQNYSYIQRLRVI